MGLITWLLCLCFIFSRTPCAYSKPVNTAFPVQTVALPLVTGITHSSAQLAPPYPAKFNSSIMPQSIATTAKADSYTGAAVSKIQSRISSVNLNHPMNRTKQFAFDHQPCCFMVQDTLQARFWADYRTLTATFTRATTIITSVTRYIDTIITNYETVDSLTNTTSIYVSQVGRIPPTQTMDCNVPILSTQLVGLNDSCTEPNKTMYTSIFYVYSTVKIIQVPPVTSTNGYFQCTTTSEFLACQSSITFDSNPYLGSYYLSQPTAATQLPRPLFDNALQSAANISVHVDTIITFPTPFTYLPSVGDRLEELGYVPRSMLDWMLQQDDYTEQASLLTSCSPGGPPLGPLNEITSLINGVITTVDTHLDTILPPPPTTPETALVISNQNAGVNTLFPSAPTIIGDTLFPPALTIIGNTLIPATLPVITDGAGDMPKGGPVVAIPGKDLTVSTAITVTSAGCFKPEACPTIRISRALTANSASADFISQTVKPGRPATTVARSKLGDTTGTANRVLPLFFTFGGQVFTPHSAGFSIDGTIISAGGRGVTIAGTAIQLESSGTLKIGTSLIDMSNTAVLDDGLQLIAYSVGGQVFTPNWIAFSIAGTTIPAEGPGVTIAGTPIRLEASGILRIGTSMASIANLASTTGHSWLATYTTGTEIFTPNPTTFAVTGTHISAGGAGITNAGTPISLETSGDRGTGGSTLISTPNHPLTTSSSPSGGDNNPIVRKRLGILFVMYLICRILALLG